MAFPKQAQDTIGMLFFILLIISLFWLAVMIVIAISDWVALRIAKPWWNLHGRPWLVGKGWIKTPTVSVTQRRKK